MYAIGNSPAYLPVLLGGLALVFFLPSVIGLIRGVEHLGVVIGLNFIPPLWPAALVGAFMLPRRRPPQISLPPPRYDQGHGSAPHGPNQPW